MLAIDLPGALYMWREFLLLSMLDKLVRPGGKVTWASAIRLTFLENLIVLVIMERLTEAL